MFGLTAEEVHALRTHGYRPAAYYESNPELRAVVDLIREGFFSRGDVARFRPLIDSLLHWDTYMLFADFKPYVDAQAEVSRAYADARKWSRMSILNVARSGFFSSDRTIREYTEEIWHVPSVPIRLLSQRDLNFGPSQ